MRKIAVVAIFCLAFVCTSCFRESNTYNATITEKHFAEHDNETSVNAVIGTINSFWQGDYSYKGLNTQEADFKADLRFLQSIASINLHWKEMENYFGENDYFIYTLKRTTGGEDLILHQYRVSKDGTEEILDVVNSDK